MGAEPAAVDEAPAPETAPDTAAVEEPAAPESAIDPAAPTDEAAPPVAVPSGSCAAYPDWLATQSADEAAGRTAADPALVNAADPDWDGIACEEGMSP